MRPVCCLNRTKNLRQSSRPHFISDSLTSDSIIPNLDKNKNTEVLRLGIFILTQRLLDAREDVLELVQPRFLVLLDNLLIIIDDLDLILRQESDRRIHIVTHGAAMEL